MGQYSIKPKPLNKNGPDALVVLPLALITVFCFSFILMQPAPPKRPSAAASRQSRSTGRNDQSTLKTGKQPNFNKLTTLPLAQTSSPQSAKSTDPQPATNGNANGHDNLTVEVANPVGKLLDQKLR